MKTLIHFFNCVSFKIKKNFFKLEINDFSHGCDKLLGNDTKNDAGNEKEVEEYLNNYSTTTRWQTV